ncbi:MAG: hypothetical protein AAGB34_01020 [Planctomycetota bacterium]
MSTDTTLQGLVATREDETMLIDALEKAFDYRGDVTVETTVGNTIQGYIFDRRRGETLGTSVVRIMLPKADENGNEKVELPFAQIARIEFTGKDPAHGKSFERYLEKFIERKTAEIEAAKAAG